MGLVIKRAKGNRVLHVAQLCGILVQAGLVRCCNESKVVFRSDATLVGFVATALPGEAFVDAWFCRQRDLWNLRSRPVIVGSISMVGLAYDFYRRPTQLCWGQTNAGIVVGVCMLKFGIRKFHDHLVWLQSDRSLNCRCNL